MDWQYNWGLYTWLLVALVCLLYGRYLYRVWRASWLCGRRVRKYVLVKLVLRGLVLGFLLVALWGPLYGYKEEVVRLEGRDIYFCIDLSASMNASDVSPTRLARVKWALLRQISDLEGSRMGVIIFSSESFIQCPLTYDVSALHLFVNALHTGLVPSSGTNLASPLRMALAKFESDRASMSLRDAGSRARAIVLYSDGEDFEGGLAAIGRAIAKSGIRLYVCGVGTEEGSHIPTGKGQVKRNKQGQAIITRYKEDALRPLLASADAKYFRVSQTKNELEELTNALRELRGEMRAARQIDVSANRYVYFLIPALVLACLDLLWRPSTLKL